MAGTLKDALGARVGEVESRLEAACRRAGRARGDVTLVAVTKTVSVAVADLLPELGLVELGESRPQELWKKERELAHAVHWHMIGHLQRNKIARTLPLVSLIHSVDSLRLLHALEEEAGKQNRHVAVLLEVNVSREPQKHGFGPDDLAGIFEQAQSLQHVQIKGLMTMAALTATSEECRPSFAGLRQLRDQLRPRLAPRHALDHLSMGMSNDFEVAVEEGATLIRLGTILFESIVGAEA